MTAIAVPNDLEPDVADFLSSQPYTTGKIIDSQRSKVYKWERAQFQGTLGAPISASDLAAIAADVCAHFHLPAPTIRFNNSQAYAGTCCITRGITISQHDGMSRWVMLHELAHWVVQNWGRSTSSRLLSHQGHGPLFVRVYAYILSRFADQDEIEVIGSARASGVRVAMVTSAPSVVPGVNPPVAGPATNRPSQAGHPRCLHCGNARYARIDSHFCTHLCAAAYAAKQGLIAPGSKPSQSLTVVIESLPEISTIRWLNTRTGWVTVDSPQLHRIASIWPAV
jgi:hypothetical protein